jgi:3-oxoacyl-[acyl-carrier-protein] synthase-3
VHGEQVCTNEDLIRNSAYNWSPMSADEISAKTGIEQRRYTWIFSAVLDEGCWVGF